MCPQLGRAVWDTQKGLGCSWYICTPSPGLLASTFPLLPRQG